MPRGSPLVTFFVVALALKKIALQIRFFSVLLKALAKFNALPPAFASPDWPDGHGDNPLYVQQRYSSNAYVPVSMINLNALGDPDWAAPEYRTKLQHVWFPKRQPCGNVVQVGIGQLP